MKKTKENLTLLNFDSKCRAFRKWATKTLPLKKKRKKQSKRSKNDLFIFD